MLNFSQLKDLANDLVNGKIKSDVFYKELFPVLVQLKAEEHHILINTIKEVTPTSGVEYGRWMTLRGMSGVFQGNYLNAAKLLREAMDVFKVVNDHAGIMAAGCLLTTCYRSVGQLDKAQQTMQETLKAEEYTKPTDIFNYFNCVTFYQAGELAVHLKNYDKAIDYFQNGMRFINTNPEFEGRLLSGLGNVEMLRNNGEKALEHFERALVVLKNSNNNLLVSKIYADIGNYFLKKGDFENALLNEKKALSIRLEHNYVNPSITSYIHLAEIYFGMEEYDEALESGKKALDLAIRLNVNIKLFELHLLLSKIYEKTGDLYLAFEHFKKYHQVQSEVMNQESIRKVEQIQSQHQMEKMEQEKEIIRLRNVELKTAMDEIHESIRYAKRIQNAILPSDASFEKYLPNSFVFYQPKDIVAGDFYFLEKVLHDDMTAVVLAACDCTGHGVPGALVSVVCSNALNRSIHEFGITDPGKILDKAREIVIREFEKSDEEVKDGMDVSLAVIQLKNNEIKSIKWAGANNPLWIVRAGNLIEYKGNKQPVGKFLKSEPFITHNIDLQKNDSIYLFSDGFADQFGGEKGKKFTAKKFQELLLSITLLPMNKQCESLRETLAQWQGTQEQVDDVLVIGLKN